MQKNSDHVADPVLNHRIATQTPLPQNITALLIPPLTLGWNSAHTARSPKPLMEILIEWLAVAAIGAAIGFAGGLFGVGGGMLAVPVLALGFGLEQQYAQGTTYVMAAPTVILGLWHYYRHGSVDARYAPGIAIAGCIAGYLGTLLALYLDPQQLRRVFSIFLLLLVAYMVISELPRFAPRPQRKRVNMRWSPAVGAFCGCLTGFFTIGGAICATPLLTRLFGLVQQRAQGLAFAAIAPGAVASFFTYAYHDRVIWHLGLPLCIGALATMRAGVAMAHRLPEKKLRILFYLPLAATAIALLSR